MGSKINPIGFRLGVNRDWEAKWYAARGYKETLNEDLRIRKFLDEKLKDASVSTVEIERAANRVNITIHTARPGMVIGKGGAEIEKLKDVCKAKLGEDKDVFINIVEIKQPDLDSQLVAENIAGQLERRVSFRRALKQAIGRTMKLGAKGIKIQVSGRLGGAEIARTEQYHEGTIPLQTMRADIDYGFAEAKTTYGRVGVKVWLYKGEVLHDNRRPRKEKEGGTK